VVANNIFLARAEPGVEATVSNNLPAGTDPRFVAGSRFELQADSPARRAGVAHAPCALGADGQPPDLGAFPYGVSAPCALVKDGRVHLFYQTYGNGRNDAICHAVSDDGITGFQRNPSNPIFRPDGTWNCGRTIDAEVFFHEGRYLMYYAKRDPGYRIQLQGVAAAPANTTFDRNEWTHLSQDGPILKPELPWEGECIEAASIIRRNGQLYMFYAGAYNNAPQQIGVAASMDGVKWTRLSDEPFLRNGKPGEWNSSESGHPAIFDDGDRSFLFFQGNPDQGQTWWISNVEVFWNEKGPFLEPSDEDQPPEVTSRPRRDDGGTGVPLHENGCATGGRAYHTVKAL
jgi:hypothetical protein